MRVWDINNSDRVTFGPCRIVANPRNGFVEPSEALGAHLKVDDLVPDFTTIRFTCNAGHRIVGADTLKCRDGTWDGDIPECVPYCQEVAQRISFTVNCSLKNMNVSCLEPAKVGTVATVACRYGFESVSAVQKSTCGTDGRWTPEPSQCTQICGERGVHANVPWHTIIYKRATIDDPYEQICGGTIINPGLIVTSAHCFWNETLDGTDDYSLFKIKTGSSLREYESPVEKENVQYFSIYSMFLLWLDRNLAHQNGVFLIITTKFIYFNPYTLPICYDYEQPDERSFVSPGLKGLLSHWVVHQNQSSSLRTTELSVIGREKCKNGTRKEFQKFITADKFCAERVSPPAVAVCPSDIGSGLVFPIETNGRTKYFLRGIFNTKTSNGSCFRIPFTPFTNVGYASESLKQENKLFMSSETFTYNDSAVSGYSQSCTVTYIPENGFASPLYSLTTRRTLGAYEQHNGTLVFGCIDNYTLKGDQTNDCLDGSWTNDTPECIPFSTGKNTGKFSKFHNEFHHFLKYSVVLIYPIYLALLSSIKFRNFKRRDRLLNFKLKNLKNEANLQEVFRDFYAFHEM